MTERVKNILSFFGRLALSGGLLAWVFSSIHWMDIIEVVKKADVGLLWFAGLIYAVINFMVLVRWYIFMRVLKLDATIAQVCRYFFIGLFCNLFLPTSIGGDLVKAIGLSRGVGQKPKVFASVVLDRLSGFAGLVIVAALSYAVGSQLIDAPSVIIPIAVLTILSLAVGGMLFNQKVYQFFGALVKKFPRVQKGIMEMHEDVMFMKGKKRAGWGCVVFSCFLQVVSAYMFYLIALALHQDVHFFPFLVFSPIVSAITFLPSIGGLGVREIGWVYFLGKIGVSQGIAVSLSLMSFFFAVVIGLIGGVVYVTTVPARRVQCDEENAAAVTPGGSVA